MPVAGDTRETPMTTLQERVHLLQVRVAALTEALRSLPAVLKTVPGLNRGRPADAARRAHELLPAAQLGQETRKP
jgi:hypothetical protein